MKEVRALFWVLVLVIAGFAVYKVVPAFWGDFKLSRMLDEQAVIYTYAMKPEQEIAKTVVEKASDFGVVLTPDEIKVDRSATDLAITATYSVHIDMPVYPFDLNFKTATHNHNVMK